MQGVLAAFFVHRPGHWHGEELFGATHGQLKPVLGGDPSELLEGALEIVLVKEGRMDGVV